MKSEKQFMNTTSSTKRLIIKRDQTEILQLRNAINERKNTIQNFNSRLKQKKKKEEEKFVNLKTSHLERKKNEKE